jgi:hypothetical protein
MPTGYILIAAQGPERLILMVSILQELRLLYCRCMTDFTLTQKIQISAVYANKNGNIYLHKISALARWYKNPYILPSHDNYNEHFFQILYIQEAFSNTSTAEEF